MSVVKHQTSEEPRESAEAGTTEAAAAKEPRFLEIRRQFLQTRLFWFLLGGVSVLLCAMVWARLPFRWLTVARASWNDERLFVEPAVLSLDGMRAKEKLTLPFQVTNLTDQKITLRWSTASNSYIAKVQLPVDIEPGEKKDLELSGLVPHAGKFSQYVLFYTSDEIKPAFFVRLAGKLAP